MKIKCRLGAFLRQRGLFHQGIRKELSAVADCSRQVIGKLLRGQAKTIDLDVLSAIAAWLVRKGVSVDELSQALIGPDAMWEQIRAATRVEIFLGETAVPGLRVPRSMVARRDAEVATSIATELTLHRPLHPQPLEFGYVPFQYGDRPPYRVPAGDRARAERLFEQLRSKQTDGHPSVTFFVGSSRINLLVELLVSTSFGTRPFCPPDQKWLVPFYLKYRSADPDLPSCFGGTKSPPGHTTGSVRPGIYYRSGDQQWNCCPNSDGGDAGIVMVTFQQASQALEVALFGFSAASTTAVGNYFLKHADEFWPPNAELTGRQVAVYICQFTWTAAEPTCSVVLLPKEILNPPPPPTHESRPDATRPSTAGAKTRKA